MYCRHHTARENWLNINPLQAEDYGEYLCTARNELGTGEGIVVLEPAGFNLNRISIIVLLLTVSDVISGNLQRAVHCHFNHLSELPYVANFVDHRMLLTQTSSDFFTFFDRYTF